jgi:hypothetical protein
MSARWVAATTVGGEFDHAVWVTHDTPPATPTSRPSREGLAACGVVCPTVIAGPNGGHDWDRCLTENKCIKCMHELGELR